MATDQTDSGILTKLPIQEPLNGLLRLGEDDDVLLERSILGVLTELPQEVEGAMDFPSDEDPINRRLFIVSLII